MRIIKIICLITVILTLGWLGDGFSAEKPKEAMPFAVYTEKNARTNHFIPSGWMGDYGSIKLDQGLRDNPHSGATCIKITYTGQPTQGAGWVGIYWQNPVNNWGDVSGGYNLKGAKNLTFWARGEEGGETVVRFGIGGIGGIYPDSAKAEIGPVVLEKEWKQYSIDLTNIDLSYISGGFYWMADKISNPEGAVFYIDEIRYE